LNAAIQAANRVKFMPNPDPGRPVFEQLREAYEKNTETIREGIRQEQQRPESAPAVQLRKASHK
jgi:hypothetical protein